ncbi:MAG: DUF1877 family protein [Bacteroidota bacterium]
MGLSVSYFHLSKESFFEVKEKILNKGRVDIEKYSIEHFYIEKSFFGLEFILMKGLGHLFEGIFAPKTSICSINFESENFKKLSVDEQFELFDSIPQESYMSPDRILEIFDQLNELKPHKIDEWYDFEELNKNKIYPEIWHNDNSENKAFNARDLKENLIELKEFLKKVTQKRNSYIIVR